MKIEFTEHQAMMMDKIIDLWHQEALIRKESSEQYLQNIKKQAELFPRVEGLLNTIEKFNKQTNSTPKKKSRKDD
jgi:hypothetical protein